jgi:hypothetical protein
MYQKTCLKEERRKLGLIIEVSTTTTSLTTGTTGICGGR